MSKVGDSSNIDLTGLNAAQQTLQDVSKNKIENKFTSFFRRIFANKRHEALKSLANGDFSQRSNIKAYAKNSKLAKALNTYDLEAKKNYYTNSEDLNNSTTNKIDRQKVTNDNFNYKNVTNWRDLLEFKSPQELIDFITETDWNEVYKAQKWDQDTIDYYAKLNWQKFVSDNSAEDIIDYIHSNPMNASKIFDAAIQVGKPYEVDQFESTQTPEYMFRDMVALYAKKQKKL